MSNSFRANFNFIPSASLDTCPTVISASKHIGSLDLIPTLGKYIALVQFVGILPHPCHGHNTTSSTSKSIETINIYHLHLTATPYSGAVSGWCVARRKRGQGFCFSRSYFKTFGSGRNNIFGFRKGWQPQSQFSRRLYNKQPTCRREHLW